MLNVSSYVKAVTISQKKTCRCSLVFHVLGFLWICNLEKCFQSPLFFLGPAKMIKMIE